VEVDSTLILFARLRETFVGINPKEEGEGLMDDAVDFNTLLLVEAKADANF
jgi:hypothetical protein